MISLQVYPGRYKGQDVAVKLCLFGSQEKRTTFKFELAALMNCGRMVPDAVVPLLESRRCKHGGCLVMRQAAGVHP